ncbi:MAG: hypothetical protein RL701_3846 [Pseudomonadota bacterium]
MSLRNFMQLGVLLGALQGQAASVLHAQTPINKVVVAQFEAPKDSGARAAVLEKLSEHSDVDVVALEDVAFVARRLHLDSTQPEGRAKLSQELGIEAWLDAQVTESEAHITLTDPHGTVLASADVEAKQPAQLARLTSERMWLAMGPHLSSSETQKRQVLAETESQQRRLLAETALARKKVERRAAEAERQRRVAQHKFASGATPAAETAPQQREVLASAPAARTRNALSSGAKTQGWNAAAGQAPVGPTGVSAATQRWLDQQQHTAASTPAPHETTAHSVAPLQPATGGVSPATQRWLEQQKIR